MKLSSKIPSSLCRAVNKYCPFLEPGKQGRRKYLKLGGTTLRGHFFLKKKGAFFKNEKGTSLFIANSWGGGHVPPVPPVPTSMLANKEKICCRVNYVVQNTFYFCWPQFAAKVQRLFGPHCKVYQ